MPVCTIAVPATTANLGPGFDCLGVALGLYNQFTFAIEPTTAPPLTIIATGLESPKISNDPDNLLYQAFLKVYEHLNETPPPLKIEVKVAVPLARGLGSSATAIVGGLLGANVLAGSPLTAKVLLDLAISLEGHPDNVAPALLGGCQLAVSTPADWLITPIAWHPNLKIVVAIPDFELSTEKARSVLPTSYSRQDAIFNASHLGLLLQALQQGRGDWLTIAMEDQIHQPYRQALIPAYAQLKAAALGAGAFNLVISGAGPTLLAIASEDNTSGVATALQNTWQKESIESRTLILELDRQGAQISQDFVY